MILCYVFDWLQNLHTAPLNPVKYRKMTASQNIVMESGGGGEERLVL